MNPLHKAQALGVPLAGSLVSEVYERHQTTPAPVTLGDTDGDVLTFAGFPDSIEVSVTAFPAIITLTDEQNRESDPIRFEVGQRVEMRIRARRVRGRNGTAGSNAVVSVLGKWLATEPYCGW